MADPPGEQGPGTFQTMHEPSSPNRPAQAPPDCGAPPSPRVGGASGETEVTRRSAVDAARARLGPGLALGVLGVSIVAQIGVAAVLGVLMVGAQELASAVGARWSIEPGSLLATMLVAPASLVLGSLAALAYLASCQGLSLRASLRSLPGWALGSTRVRVSALLAGLAVALFYAVLGTWLWPADQGQATGPLVSLALSGWPGYLVWAVLGLAIAPPIEEWLFRGVLFAGFSRDFGDFVAAILVTVVFVGLHAGEAVYYWPAFFGITGLGLLCVWLRIRYDALGPPLLAHVGYNALLVILLASA